MNLNDSPNLAAVDQLLTRFMKSEMPNPWPKAPSPSQLSSISPASLATPPSSSPLVGSRLSLAASVALIIGGCWLLSNIVGDGPSRSRPANLNGGTANTKHLEKLFKSDRPK